MDEFLNGLGVAAVVLAVVLGVVALVLAVLMVRRYRLVRRPETPFPTKFAFWSSLVYAVFPIDLLPDPVYLDDIGVLTGGLLYVSASLRKRYGSGRRARTDSPQ